MVVQGNRNRYQLKAHATFSWSFIVTICLSCIISEIAYNDLLVENLRRFRRFYPCTPVSFDAIARGLATWDLWDESLYQKSTVRWLRLGDNFMIL